MNEEKPKGVVDTVLMYLASGVAVPGYFIGAYIKRIWHIEAPYDFIDGCIVSILCWILGLMWWFNLNHETRDEIFNCVWRLICYVFLVGCTTFLVLQIKR